MTRKPDLFNQLEGLAGRTVSRADVHYPMSLGILSLSLTFTDGTCMTVSIKEYGQQRTPALRLALPDPGDGV